MNGRKFRVRITKRGKQCPDIIQTKLHAGEFEPE
jgi:hypothetical protein